LLFDTEKEKEMKQEEKEEEPMIVLKFKS